MGSIRWKFIRYPARLLRADRMNVLELLEREGPLSTSEIASKLGYALSSVKRCVYELKAMGLIAPIAVPSGQLRLEGWARREG